MIIQIDEALVKNTIIPRSAEADKTQIGTLLSICGSYGMAGAAIMSSNAALRSGLGLLELCVPDSVYPILAGSVPEAVFIPYKYSDELKLSALSKYCSAILIGCGLSVNNGTIELVKKVIEESTIPLVLDADALNIVSENTEVLKNAKTPGIITPHVREFSRLSEKSVDDINSEKEKYAKEFAEKHQVTVVLKGHKTVVASHDGKLAINTEHGNAGMAVGGSGDVLAGITAAFAAQGFDIFGSACSAVFIHALAGDIAKEKLGMISMLPTDIIKCLPDAFMRIFP